MCPHPWCRRPRHGVRTRPRWPPGGPGGSGYTAVTPGPAAAAISADSAGTGAGSPRAAGSAAVAAGPAGADLGAVPRQHQPGVAERATMTCHRGPFGITGWARQERSRGGFEHHNRDLAAGLLLVVVVGRPDRRHLPPHLRLFFRRGNPGPCRELVAHDLDADIGVRDQVEIPGRRLVRPALGRHHQVVIAVLLVDQGMPALLPALAARRGEDQRRRTLPVVPLRAVGLLVPPDVLVSKQHVFS